MGNKPESYIRFGVRFCPYCHERQNFDPVLDYYYCTCNESQGLPRQGLLFEDERGQAQNYGNQNRRAGDKWNG